MLLILIVHYLSCHVIMFATNNQNNVHSTYMLIKKKTTVYLFLMVKLNY